VNRLEHALQVGIVRMIRATWPEVIVYAVPNGGARSITEAKRLKDEGVTSGVSDLALVLPSGQAAFIEVKTPKGVLSDAQKAFRDRCYLNGIPWACARSLPDAVEILNHFCGGPARSFVALGGGANAPADLSSAEATRASV
jgi:hypothetical protein